MPKSYKFKKFINDKIMNKVNGGIDWFYLSLNINAIKILQQNQDKINWNLSKNKNAIELLKENEVNINWEKLSFNENAIELLKVNIDWNNLCLNKNCMEIFKDYPEKINWYRFSMNPYVIKILKSNEDKIDFKGLLYNDKGMSLYFKNNKMNNYYIYIILSHSSIVRIYKYNKYI